MEMDRMEIEGGVSIQEVVKKGAVFNVQYDPSEDGPDPEEQECALALANYLKFECLDSGNSYDGEEPFSTIGKEMDNLLENGDIKKKILRQGYGELPEISTTVHIHYNAYVQFEAEPFDSTYVRKKPFSFVIGNGDVITGLEIAVRSMKINEKARFIIQPALAYRGGVTIRIPPDSVVLFEIELCEMRKDVIEDIPESDKRKFEYVYPQCLALCVKGKNMFRLNDFRGAIKEYHIAVDKLEDVMLNDYDEQMKSEELLVRLYTNLLVCCTKAQIPKRGCVFAQKIYEMSKNKTFQVSAKVYFNHAKCQRMLGDFERTERKLRQAKALEPNNPEILKELESLRKAKEENRRCETKFAKALLNK